MCHFHAPILTANVPEKSGSGRQRDIYVLNTLLAGMEYLVAGFVRQIQFLNPGFGGGAIGLQPLLGEHGQALKLAGRIAHGAEPHDGALGGGGGEIVDVAGNGSIALGTRGKGAEPFFRAGGILCGPALNDGFERIFAEVGIGKAPSPRGSGGRFGFSPGANDGKGSLGLSGAGLQAGHEAGGVLR